MFLNKKDNYNNNIQKCSVLTIGQHIKMKVQYRQLFVSTVNQIKIQYRKH